MNSEQNRRKREWITPFELFLAASLAGLLGMAVWYHHWIGLFVIPGTLLVLFGHLLPRKRSERSKITDTE